MSKCCKSCLCYDKTHCDNKKCDCHTTTAPDDEYGWLDSILLHGDTRQRRQIISHIQQNYTANSEVERVKREAAMNNQFFLMTELHSKFLGYLFVHTTQEGFPEMSGQIIREAYKWRNDKFEEAADVVAPRAQLSNKENTDGK